MIGEEVRNEGLAALSVAAAELVEDHHREPATLMPDDVEAQIVRMRRLRDLGSALAPLGKTGIFLVRASLPPAGTPELQAE